MTIKITLEEGRTIFGQIHTAIKQALYPKELFADLTPAQMDALVNAAVNGIFEQRYELDR